MDKQTPLTGTLLGDLMREAGERKPLPKRLQEMVVQGIVYAVVILILATLVSAATGQSTLAARVDRNAQVTVEGAKALRCVASRPLQDRSFKEQQAFVDACYARFDQLVEEVGNEG